jgi:Tfp pilus assembly protein PilF
VYYEQKKLPEAAVEYQRAIQLDTQCAQAHQNYGLLLLEQGKFELASAELQRAHQLDPYIF